MTKTEVSMVINAPMAKVWETIRPFDSLGVWHPMVAKCFMEEDQPNNALGAIRNIKLKEDGGIVRETLLAISDLSPTIVYDIIESPMPVENYIATIRLYDVTESNQTYAHWEVVFDTSEDQKEEMIDTLQDVFRSGFVELNRILEANHS